MQTGFEIMDYDRNLKNLWIRRTLAATIDAIASYIVAMIIIYLFRPMDLVDYVYIFLLQGPVWFVYALIFDIINGKTPGKYIFKIRAVAFIGNIRPLQAVLRNITKLNAILAIADAVAGLSTEGDPRQRYSERFINTLVISERKIKRIKQFHTVETKKSEELVLPK